MPNNPSSSSGSSRTTAWFIVGFIVLVTAVVIIAGAMSSGSSSGSQSATNPNFVATVAPAITVLDWSQGNPNAAVSVVEYGDFECPACAEYQPLVKQIIQNNSTTIRFVFRNFPLTSIHPDANISSQAAEAAGLQGKYWEMHDLLYTKQNDWVTTSPDQVVAKYFDGYAQSLGLDVAKFNTDITSSRVLGKIQTDVAGGTSAKLDHTPTYFINLKQIPNPTSYSDFQKAIDAALASASSAVTTSTATSTAK
ncbi:MAG: thioredoxin domain-containing protein [Candidatus Pacebacteria bacterium]|nr:thioredoxin domain-containing protein [Candidatus Paceibacterota bacterium]